MELTASSRPIFLSVSHVLDADQQEFVSELDHYLNKRGWELKTVGRGMEKSKRAHIDIRAMIDECVGTLVVATKRLHVASGILNDGPDSAVEIAERSYPSVWMQIEGAMALHKGHPLLLLREEGLHQEGLYLPSFLPSVPFRPPTLNSEVRERLDGWISDLRMDGPR